VTLSPKGIPDERKESYPRSSVGWSLCGSNNETHPGLVAGDEEKDGKEMSGYTTRLHPFGFECIGRLILQILNIHDA